MRAEKIRSLRKELRWFERLMGSQQKDTCCCCGVTAAQCHVLLEIDAHGQVLAAELSNNLGLDKSTLSRTIDGLFNIGLVERVPHPSDRRCMLIALTKQGSKVCEEMNKANDEYYLRVFQAISDEKLDVIIENLGLLVKTMRGSCGEPETCRCESSCGG